MGCGMVPRDHRHDGRQTVTVSLRPYQQQFKDAIESAWTSGAKNVIGVLPTRGGKTFVFTVINSDGKHSVTIVHRQELVGQISLSYARLGVRHNIIAPQKVINFCIALHVRKTGRSWFDPAAPAHVAGVDTLIRRFKPGDPWCQKIQRWTLDEAHHALAENKWGKAVALFPNARGLGVTATPIRSDNRSLHAAQGGVFDALVQGPVMRDLIDLGNICEYRIVAPESSINEALLKIGSTGDYTAASVKAAQRATITGDIVDAYQRHTPGQQAIVFNTDVEDAVKTAERFNDAGIPAAALSAKSTDDERQKQADAFATGKLQVLTNVDLFGEGYDVPTCSVVIMARRTASFGLFCQQFARCLTPDDGKTHGTIIDQVGNVLSMAATHGLPDTPRRWSLWKDEKQRGTARNPDATPVRICTGCAMVYEAVRKQCPFCGTVHTPEGRGAPDLVDGMLSEMSPELLAKLRAAKAARDAPEPAIPYGVADYVARGIRNRHRDTQAALARLSDVMQQWGGRRLAAGDDDAAMQARFFHRFGVDVLSAQSLNERSALELADQIQETLTDE